MLFVKKNLGALEARLQISTKPQHPTMLQLLFVWQNF